jgi:hypothetical protein
MSRETREARSGRPRAAISGERGHRDPASQEAEKAAHADEGQEIGRREELEPEHLLSKELLSARATRTVMAERGPPARSPRRGRQLVEQEPAAERADEMDRVDARLHGDLVVAPTMKRTPRRTMSPSA